MDQRKMITLNLKACYKNETNINKNSDFTNFQSDNNFNFENYNNGENGLSFFRANFDQTREYFRL